MRAQIKDANGKLVDVNVEDLTVDGKTLGQFLEEFNRLKKDYETHKQKEAASAQEMRELWRSIKK